MNLDKLVEYAESVISGDNICNADDVASHLIDVISFAESLAERLEELEEVHKDDKGRYVWSSCGEVI